MYIVILILIGVSILGLWIAVCLDEESSPHIATGLLLLFILYIVFLLCLRSHNISTPSAMDVYQGKTELKYTVQGGEITDSVVVYKN